MIDTNKYIFKEKFKEALADDVIDLEDAYHRVHNEKMLSFHISGSELSMGVFISLGIDCNCAFIGCHKLAAWGRGPQRTAHS